MYNFLIETMYQIYDSTSKVFFSLLNITLVLNILFLIFNILKQIFQNQIFVVTCFIYLFQIADFGLSNVFDDKHLLNTYCGSPLYASPEIVKGVPYYGPEVILSIFFKRFNSFLRIKLCNFLYKVSVPLMGPLPKFFVYKKRKKETVRIQLRLYNTLQLFFN